MFAQNPWGLHRIVEPGVDGSTAERALDGAGPISRWIEAAAESSLTFVVRFPARPTGSIRAAGAVRTALEQVLLELCDLSVIPFDDRTVAAVISPRSGQPFDPLHVHSMMALLARALHEAGGIPDDGPEPAPAPLIVPVAYVNSAAVIQENLAALNDLLETILNKRLKTAFQAIVHLEGARVYGYEALIRNPEGGALRKPGEMFRVADGARLVSWLDLACQEQCFEAAAAAGVREHLFVNMDAEGLAYLHFADRSLADRAAACGIPPNRVVLEITERQAVDDFPRLLQYVEGLRGQGFKVAIDDAGTGYNSLHAIAELRPDFVKIDRKLVRDVHDNPARRALLATLARFAIQIGTAVIAEGIETRDELAAIVEIGVPYAQGYLLSKPSGGFRGLRREMREQIGELRERRAARLRACSLPIGSMARRGVVTVPETPAAEVARKFARGPDLGSVVVVREGRVEGLVMRAPFLRAAADRVPGEEPVSNHMDPRPLVVEADTPIDEVAYRLTVRREPTFYADVLVEREGLYAGVVPVYALMEALAAREADRAAGSRGLARRAA